MDDQRQRYGNGPLETQQMTPDVTTDPRNLLHNTDFSQIQLQRADQTIVFADKRSASRCG